MRQSEPLPSGTQTGGAPLDPNVPSGKGWDRRLHWVYMPVFTLLNTIGLYYAVTVPLKYLFPAADGEFLSHGGIRTPLSSWLLVAAGLPLATVLSRLSIWLLLEYSAFAAPGQYRIPIEVQTAFENGVRASGLSRLSPRLLVASMLWLAALSPVIFYCSSRYISLGSDGVVIGQGGFHLAHDHPWSDLRAIRSVCMLRPEGKTHMAVYTLVFTGEQDFAIPLSDAGEMEDFLSASRKLGPLLKRQTFAFAYNGDPACPARWLPALSEPPGMKL